MGLNRTVSVAAGLAVLFTTALAQATPSTAATDSAVTALSTLPNYYGSQATGINDNGTIIGWSTTPQDTQAMRWDTNGTVTELRNLPGYLHSYAYGINKTGTVVGSSYSTVDGHASRWGSDGTVTDLGILPGTKYSVANGINDNGVIVGHSGIGYSDHAVRWDANGTITDLNKLPAVNSVAMGINNYGTVIGKILVNVNSSTGQGVWHAARWAPDGTVTDLGTLPGDQNSIANGINSAGAIVGQSYGAYGSNAVRWDPNGTVTNLGALPSDSASDALAINDNGVIVGWSSPNGALPHPVLWNNTGVIADLPTNGRTDGDARAINYGGTVVGTTDDPPYSYAVRWTQPQLAVAPAVLDFNAVPVGQSMTKTFDVANIGTVPVTITKSIPPTGVFSTSTPVAEGQVLAPGAVLHLSVTFTPTNTLGTSAQWALTGNAGQNAIVIQLNGNTHPIQDYYLSLGGPNSYLGAAVNPVYSVGNGGMAQDFRGGSIYWSPTTGAHAVHGAILDHYKAFGGPGGVLGYPTTDETTTPDGIGRYNHFNGTGGASIYWTPQTGAWAIYGNIRQHWAALGWETGPLGYPTTDETGTPDGIGRYNHFSGGSGGSIYWTPQTGAWAIYGSIRQHWAALGWETGPLGYPTTDETGTPDGIGRYNHFSGGGGGSIYWTAQTGAQAIYGAIRQHWAALGWERGPLGYPTSDEFNIPGGRRNNLVHGAIEWYAADGSTATIYY